MPGIQNLMEEPVRITSDQHLPASPGAIARMLVDQSFIEQRGMVTEARIEDSVVTGSPDADFTITTRRSVPADQIPAQMRPFVGARLEVRQVDAWEPEDAGARTGTVVLEITGTPVRLTGTVNLSPHPDGGSVLRYDGVLKAAVPLFASAIEQAAASAVRAGLEKEAKTARAWLAEHPEG